MADYQAIAARTADLMEQGHWAASTLRGAFSYAVFGGRYGRPIEGGYPDYGACIAFERHWIGEREHRNDGMLVSETASDKAARVGHADTVAALRAFARGEG